jgi:FAD/FMN-containing dehydrogenase
VTMTRTLESWGRHPRSTATVVPVYWRSDAALSGARPPMLAHGLGRSYGDACLNDGGVLLSTRTLDRFIALDEERETVTCEAGVTLGGILDVVAPRGLYLPVVPGTRHVTVGGAVANDVHGKNHHRAGTFGRHVEEIELLRSTGARVRCGPARETALFAATVGGLGLTGLMLSATLRLRRIPSRGIRCTTVPLRGLAEYLDLSRRADAEDEYTVAWIDCLARGRALGRGLLHRGGWAEPARGARAPRPRRRLAVPFELPFSPLNRVTLAALNGAYYLRHRVAPGTRRVDADRFFFPLDGVERWNRLYGRRGLVQFQCVLPPAAAEEGLRALLETVARAGEGSFLAVLKNFGPLPSPGLLSFPREGVTLALDFRNRGERTARLLATLYGIVAAHGGRVYPAKDAHMPPELFQAQHADVLPAFRAQLDPAFSSSFWRRVMPGVSP